MTDLPGKSFSVALLGKGGTGVVTAGDILLAAAARCGLYGLMIRTVGPQIRGGESAALLRIGFAPIDCLDDRFDLVLGIDWKDSAKNLEEIAVDGRSIVVTDPAEDDVPASILMAGAAVCELQMKALADSVDGGRVNMVALGYAACLAGVTESAVSHAIEQKIGAKGRDVVAASIAAAKLGFAQVRGSTPALDTDGHSGDRWMISGNHATGLGAIRGGVRFAAAYPITPATEILEWLAPRLTDAGGTVTQAEDELASINMAIGASYGGIPSLTATSGPGLSLMIEGLGLAVCAEVPVVVIDVMRVGPSTGIPTKPEQSDFNAAVYGLHGDAPHIVVAPTSVSDCVFTTQWAVHLAEAMQAPVIVLSDQFIGQTMVIADPIPSISFFAKRKLAREIPDTFARYAITADGISPMPLPGTPDGQYTADGLEHSAEATPSGTAADHHEQLDKRARKITNFDYGQHWAEIEGDGDLAILTWGSATSAVREATQRLPADRSAKLRLISLRLLLPIRPIEMAAALEGVERLMVIEQNHTGQLHRFLRAWYELPADVDAVHRPGPGLFRPGELAEQISKWCDQ